MREGGEGGGRVEGEISVFFFFQAEDGIRDYKVTGVQTCALPIYWWITNDNRLASILLSFGTKCKTFYPK